MRPLLLTHPDAGREQLVSLAKEIPGAWIGLKIAGMLLLAEGQRPAWIVEVLGVPRASLNRWRQEVNIQGLAALKPTFHPGRPSQLTRGVRRALTEHLRQSPERFGLKRVGWDGPTLAEHLKRQFGIKLTVRQAQKWLHQLGYRLKRASYVYVQARRQKAQWFQRTLKKTPSAGTERDRGLSG